MPVEYEHMRDAMIREGVPEKEAKRIAAIKYYKKHGRAVNSLDRRKKKK
jgi:hypothetical protein